MRVFITKNGRQLGPFTLDQVRSQVNDGAIEATDWAWYEGQADWIPLNHIPGFSTQQTAALPPRDTPPPTPLRRPTLVWIICIYYFISFPFALFALAAVFLSLSGVLPVSETQRHYYATLNFFDYILIVGAIFLNLAGAICLFLLRRAALYLLGATFVLSIFNLIYQIIFKNWLALIDTDNLTLAITIFSLAVGYLINIAILGYIAYLYLTRFLR